jgi:hypothetical protein
LVHLPRSVTERSNQKAKFQPKNKTTTTKKKKIQPKATMDKGENYMYDEFNDGSDS